MSNETQHTSDEIKIGDKVEHIDGTWLVPSTVKTIILRGDPEFVEPVATFVEGGFWRLEKLRKVKSDDK